MGSKSRKKRSKTEIDDSLNENHLEGKKSLRNNYNNWMF